MAPWTLSPRHHRTIVAARQLIRLELAVAAEESRLRRTLSVGQLAGRACARCGSEVSDLRPAAQLDGVTLAVCAAHDLASEVA